MSVIYTIIELPLSLLIHACVIACITIPAAFVQYTTASHLAAAIAGEAWSLPPPTADTEEPPRFTFSQDADGKRLRLGLLWALHIMVFHSTMNLPWALDLVTLPLGVALGSMPLLVPHGVYTAHTRRCIAVYVIYLYTCSLFTTRVAQRYQPQPRYVAMPLLRSHPFPPIAFFHVHH